MKSIQTFCIIISFLLLPFPSPAESETRDILENNIPALELSLTEHPDDLSILSKLCSFYTITCEFSRAMAYADRLLSLTENDSSSHNRITALAYASQAYLAADRYDKAAIYLKKGITLWEEKNGEGLPAKKGKSITPISILYNCAGVYCVNYKLDYEKATYYFIKGLSFARNNSAMTDYAIIGYNLILTFFLRDDPSGLKFAEEIYEFGKSSANLRLTYMGAYESALMYFLKEDYDNAEKYINEALNSPVKIDSVWVYNIYANILSASGKDQEALGYYEKSYRSIEGESATTSSYVCLSYGKHLLKSGKVNEAVQVLQKGISIANGKMNKTFICQLYNCLSISCSLNKEYEKALSYYQIYHSLYDSIFNIKKERAINELISKYKTALYEAEIWKKDVKLTEKNYTILLTTSMAVMASVIFLILFFMYRHKNSMYTKIVRQHQDTLRKEKYLEEIAMSYRNAAKEGMPGSIAQDKSEEILNRIEELMQESNIYKDKALSRDKLAEMAGTNRTYLSKIINECFGKSVSRYINSYRISKAIELLSDLKSDLPMKAIESDAGFNSSSSFFKLFKEEVGISPANFRKKIIEFSKKQDTDR